MRAVCQRITYLAAHGYRVLRFWNNQVLEDLIAVVSVIDNVSTNFLKRRIGKSKKQENNKNKTFNVFP